MTFDDYFKLPIILIDGDHEELKREQGTSNLNADFIISELEVPYYDTIISIMDSWIPTEKGRSKAFDNTFTACHVTFMEAGGFRVKMTKSRFKDEWSKFCEEREEVNGDNKNMAMIPISQGISFYSPSSNTSFQKRLYSTLHRV